MRARTQTKGLPASASLLLVSLAVTAIVLLQAYQLATRDSDPGGLALLLRKYRRAESRGHFSPSSSSSLSKAAAVVESADASVVSAAPAPVSEYERAEDVQPIPVDKELDDGIVLVTFANNAGSEGQLCDFLLSAVLAGWKRVVMLGWELPHERLLVRQLQAREFYMGKKLLLRRYLYRELGLELGLPPLDEEEVPLEETWEKQVVIDPPPSQAGPRTYLDWLEEQKELEERLRRQAANDTSVVVVPEAKRERNARPPSIAAVAVPKQKKMAAAITRRQEKKLPLIMFTDAHDVVVQLGPPAAIAAYREYTAEADAEEEARRVAAMPPATTSPVPAAASPSATGVNGTSTSLSAPIPMPAAQEIPPPPPLPLPLPSLPPPVHARSDFLFSVENDVWPQIFQGKFPSPPPGAAYAVLNSGSYITTPEAAAGVLRAMMLEDPSYRPHELIYSETGDYAGDGFADSGYAVDIPADVAVDTRSWRLYRLPHNNESSQVLPTPPGHALVGPMRLRPPGFLRRNDQIIADMVFFEKSALRLNVSLDYKASAFQCMQIAVADVDNHVNKCARGSGDQPVSLVNECPFPGALYNKRSRRVPVAVHYNGPCKFVIKGRLSMAALLGDLRRHARRTYVRRAAAGADLAAVDAALDAAENAATKAVEAELQAEKAAALAASAPPVIAPVVFDAAANGTVGNETVAVAAAPDPATIAAATAAAAAAEAEAAAKLADHLAASVRLAELDAEAERLAAADVRSVVKFFAGDEELTIKVADVCPALLRAPPPVAAAE